MELIITFKIFSFVYQIFNKRFEGKVKARIESGFAVNLGQGKKWVNVFL